MVGLSGSNCSMALAVRSQVVFVSPDLPESSVAEQAGGWRWLVSPGELSSVVGLGKGEKHCGEIALWAVVV